MSYGWCLVRGQPGKGKSGVAVLNREITDNELSSRGERDVALLRWITGALLKVNAIEDYIDVFNESVMHRIAMHVQSTHSAQITTRV